MLAYFGAPSMLVGSVSLPKGRVQRQSWWGELIVFRGFNQCAPKNGGAIQREM